MSMNLYVRPLGHNNHRRNFWSAVTVTILLQVLCHSLAIV